MKNTVAVVIPHKDRKDNLFKCLDGIAKQDEKPDFVVIADYSEDRLEKVDEYCSYAYGITFYQIHPEGEFALTHARNAGIKYIGEKHSPDIISVLDCDCILPYHAMKDALSFFGPRQDYRVIVGGRAVYETRQKDSITWKAYNWSGKILSGGWQTFRAIDFFKVGGYNPFITGWGFEDQDFVARMSAAGVRPVIAHIPYFHLWHKDAQTKEERAEQEARNIKISKKTWYNPVSKKWEPKQGG